MYLWWYLLCLVFGLLASHHWWRTYFWFVFWWLKISSWQVWSGSEVVLEVQPDSLTEVSVKVGPLSEGSVVGLEVRLITATTSHNTTVFFTTVFLGQLHSWSLHTAGQRNVTKYLCGLSQTHQHQVNCKHVFLFWTKKTPTLNCFTEIFLKILLSYCIATINNTIRDSF